MKNTIAALILVCCSFQFEVCQAELCVTIQETVNGNIEVSWTGSGTVSSTSGVANTIDLSNFGDIFNFTSQSSVDGGSLNIENITDSTSLAITQVNLFNSNSSNQDDVDFIPAANFSTVFSANDQYSVSGSVVFTDLSINDFVIGNFQSGAGGQVPGDSDNFGGAKLSIIASVPEPSTLTLFASSTCLLLIRRRR